MNDLRINWRRFVRRSRVEDTVITESCSALLSQMDRDQLYEALLDISIEAKIGISRTERDHLFETLSKSGADA